MIHQKQVHLPLTQESIYLYFQRNVRPSGGSVDHVSFPNISISDKYHLQTDINHPITNNSPVNAHLLGTPIKSAIITSMISSPHFPQLFPRDLALIANGKNTINKEYPTSPTSRNQFVAQNLMTTTLPVFTKFHEKQIPLIGSNYALTTTNTGIPSLINNSKPNLDFSLPVMDSSNLHNPPSNLPDISPSRLCPYQSHQLPKSGFLLLKMK